MELEIAFRLKFIELGCLLSLLVLTIGCNEVKNNDFNSTENKSEEFNDTNYVKTIDIINEVGDRSQKVIPDSTKFENFEVTYLYYRNERLTRIFVVLDSTLVYQEEIISNIIKEVKKQFDTNLKTNVSFFSDKKYADYKDAVFYIKTLKYDDPEYQNWKNHYYLGEFDFETGNYKTYPSCNFRLNRQKTFFIK